MDEVHLKKTSENKKNIQQHINVKRLLLETSCCLPRCHREGSSFNGSRGIVPKVQLK